jgi:DNA-binding sugar fermentation-stimulating protein
MKMIKRGIFLQLLAARTLFIDQLILFATGPQSTMVATRRTMTAALEASAPRTPPAKTATKPSKHKASRSAGTPVKTQEDKMPPKPIKVSTSDGERLLLFSLAENDELVKAKMVCRPSKRNRSPYVADVWLEEEQREVIAHVPSLDMGGKCVAGATILLRPARDPKGVKVPGTAVSPKYGTPKCEFIAQLLHVDESGLAPSLYPPTWVGAHPSLGERIAESWLWNNLVEGIPSIVDMQAQVRNPCGADMRSDFLLHHADGTKRLVEVKTVVDTDYSTTAPPTNVKCLFLTDATPYTRTAIFPWGNSNQKGPDGEKVVSARAIKHVHEMTQIVQGKLSDGEATAYEATVLFVVIRGDAERFRPNHEACPSFRKYLKAAETAGVQVLAKCVSWGAGVDEGKCFDGKMLPIEWPESKGGEV